MKFSFRRQVFIRCVQTFFQEHPPFTSENQNNRWAEFVTRVQSFLPNKTGSILLSIYKKISYAVGGKGGGIWVAVCPTSIEMRRGEVGLTDPRRSARSTTGHGRPVTSSTGRSWRRRCRRCRRGSSWRSWRSRSSVSAGRPCPTSSSGGSTTTSSLQK